jgi:hypothetical protein
MASLPQAHDVIVHKSAPRAANPYDVGIYHGSIQFSAPSARDACDHANRFAGKQLVDVWYTEDQQQYIRMTRFRPA